MMPAIQTPETHAKSAKQFTNSRPLTQFSISNVLQSFENVKQLKKTVITDHLHPMIMCENSYTLCKSTYFKMQCFVKQIVNFVNI